MFNQQQKNTGFVHKSSKPMLRSQFPLKANSNCTHVPTTAGTGAPSKEGELRCYECGQKGHIKPQCPKFKGKQRVARAQFNNIKDGGFK